MIHLNADIFAVWNRLGALGDVIVSPHRPAFVSWNDKGGFVVYGRPSAMQGCCE